MRLRTWILAFVAFAALGGTWALASPVLSNPDEPAHSVKAAAVVRGQLVPPKEALPDHGPGELLRGGFTTLVDVPASYSWQTSELTLCYIYDHRAPAGCAPDFVADDTEARWTTLIGRYPPPYYAVVGWPTAIDTGSGGFYAMRFLSVGVNAALLATALACAAATSRLRFLAVGVLLAATPQAILLTGAVNPNGIEVSAAICTWVAGTVALLHRGDRLPRGVLGALAAGSIVLAWSRPLATLWLAVIAVVLLAAFGDRERLATRLRGRAERIVVAVVGLTSLGAASWTVLADNLDNNAGYEPRGLGLWPAARHSLELTPSYLRQMVAVFGWQREPSPVWLTWAWGAAVLAVVAAAVLAGRRSTRASHSPLDRADDVGWRRRGVVLGLVALTLLLPTIMQAPTAERFGFVWSGRYALAIGAGVPIVAAAVAATRGLGVAVERWLAGAIVAVVAAGHVVAHGANMRRYVVGLDGPVVYLGHDGWTPPLGAPLLLGAVVLSATALAALAYRLATTPSTEGADASADSAAPSPAPAR